MTERPGFKLMNGARPYWVANPAANKQGYAPKTVRLAGEPETWAAQCQMLQAKMLQWLALNGQRAGQPRGTIAWLIDRFETDPDSPMRRERSRHGEHGLRAETAAFYSRYGRLICAAVGERRIADVTGKDVRRWHANWTDRHGPRAAHACIQTLRRAVKWGVEDGNTAALKLSAILREMRFAKPARRDAFATSDMVRALVEVADAAGHAGIGTATLMQFETAMRQKDVIGEWVRHEGPRAGVMDGDWRWQWGLSWGHIDADWIVRKPTSKSNGVKAATFDLKETPHLLARLQAVPRESRVGPVILAPRGKPYRTNNFREQFRNLATRAGWPAGVWNMDSRAGAVTEAFAAGASGDDAQRLATHGSRAMTERYNRTDVEQTARVTRLRIAARKQAGNTGE